MGALFILLLFTGPAILGGLASYHLIGTGFLLLSAIVIGFSSVCYVFLFVIGGNSEVWSWFWFLIFPILTLSTLAGVGVGRLAAARRKSA
jgi:cellulose synthase/poly-beta-1,6-N-acetylglucosamine synthase-like glycosyltransferase